MIARHSLVWLSADGWQRLAKTVVADHRATLARWQQADWPLVLRRRETDIADDELCLGLALPPDGNGDKVRMPLRALQADIQRLEEPLTLQKTLAYMPSGWSGPLHTFASDCRHSDIVMRVYGSWAWQVLTQQNYVTASSDIDLLFTPRSALEFSRGITLLAQYATRLPLDGEVIFPDGQAVAWKECWQALHASSQPRVLVKTLTSVQLLSLESLVSSLDATC